VLVEVGLRTTTSCWPTSGFWASVDEWLLQAIAEQMRKSIAIFFIVAGLFNCKVFKKKAAPKAGTGSFRLVVRPF
jgi:hypothetical protein